ncbi:MAG: VWA domain-containing protein [Burkholderiales bacterium]
MRAAVLLAAALAFAGCDEAKPPAKPAAAPQKPKGPISTRPLTPAWPAAAQAKADQASVSGDLFARNYYVVLDASGSMTERGCSGDMSKIDAARIALAAFAESLPADANLALQVFDARGVREWIPLAPGNRAKFKAVLGNVRAGGGTPLHSAITQAYARLEAQGSRQLGYGEYHLVIVTDGEASDGQDPTGAVKVILDRSPIVLHTIGFCIGPKHSLNQPGRTLYRAADDPNQLRQHLSDVLAEAPTFAVTGFK